MLGWLLVALAAAQLIPAAACLFWGEPILPFLASAIAAAVFGLSIALNIEPTHVQIRVRDGFVLATGAWLLAAVFGGLPYLTTGTLGPLDAFSSPSRDSPPPHRVWCRRSRAFPGHSCCGAP